MTQYQGSNGYSATSDEHGLRHHQAGPKASEMCIIIFPWGKYSYKRLPKGFGGSADIFHAQTMDLMASLEFVQAYMDDLLIITRGILDKHLQKMETVPTRLCDSRLKVIVAKSFFCAHEIEYFGYILTRDGIKPPTKESAGDTCPKPAQQC